MDRVRRFQFSLRTLLLYVAIAAALAAAIWGVIVPSINATQQAAREAGRKTTCISQLKMLGLAMHNYNAKYGCFPPAYIADSQGRPMHSWRVLLLEFLDPQLYRQYDFSNPWNHPDNLRLADKLTISSGGAAMSDYYCPSDYTPGKTETNYVMIVGPGAFSDGTSSTRPLDVRDGTSTTIAVVEMSNSGIHWMEPRDLDFGTMSFQINDPNAPGIRSRHKGTATVMCADGSVTRLVDDDDPKAVQAAITIDGGEPAAELFD